VLFRSQFQSMLENNTTDIVADKKNLLQKQEEF